MISLASPGTELARFKKGTLPKLSIVVLLFIPLIYGALYLWAFWAPTDELKNLPVALVNEDTGGITSDGSRLTAGADVESKLVDGNDLDWQTTDAASAAAGVSDGTYYFSVTIPSNFSQSVLSVDSDAPEQAQLQVEYNDSNSFLASTLGKSAMIQVRDAVAESVSAGTADTLLVGVSDLSDGIRSAADGAGKLSDGATALNTGTGDLVVGLTDLANGTSTLSAGASTLANGVGQLHAGSVTLSNGLQTAADGAGALVSEGTGPLSTGAGSVNEGAARLNAGLSDLQTATATLPDATAQLSAGASAVSRGTGAIAQALAANPDMTLAQLDAYLQSNGSSLAGLAGGASAVASGASTLADSAPSLSGGISQLAAGSSDLSSGAAQLAAGATTLNGKAGELSAGLGDLNAGAAQLSAKLSEASNGANTLATGAAALNDGGAKAAAGGAQLAAGTSTLAAGSSELSSKLADGADKAPDLSASQQASMSEVIANPVGLDAQHVTEATSFGEGFAPFFIALATFVGALITWLILRALPTRALASRASGLRSTLTGFIPAGLIGAGQVVIMMLVLVYGIGLRPEHWVGTAAFIYLTTLAFLALQQMFIILLGSASGRVVSLVLLMLQLSSSGGTYPVETTPVFFQILHPLMPASYVVTGLRQLITGGIDGRFWGALAYMIGLLVVSLAVSAFAAGKQKVWSIKRLHPELTV